MSVCPEQQQDKSPRGVQTQVEVVDDSAETDEVDEGDEFVKTRQWWGGGGCANLQHEHTKGTQRFKFITRRSKMIG